jgi:hypothetical protein
MTRRFRATFTLSTSSRDLDARTGKIRATSGMCRAGDGGAIARYVDSVRYNGSAAYRILVTECWCYTQEFVETAMPCQG